jgi:hypothetical protein
MTPPTDDTRSSGQAVANGAADGLTNGQPPGDPVSDRKARVPDLSPAEQAQLIENMFAPEVYATVASSFSAGFGSVTIKLVSMRWDNSVDPPVQKAVVVGRVTMPLQGAQALAGGLQSFLTQNGLEPVQSNRGRTRATDISASSPVRQPQ